MADRLVVQVVGLLSESESGSVWETLQAGARQSPAYLKWLESPHRYLSDLDDTTANRLEAYLRDLVPDLQKAARERGWEIPER